MADLKNSFSDTDAQKNKKHKFLRHLRNYFFEGLLIILPVGLSIWIFYFLVRYIFDKLAFLKRFLPLELQEVEWITIVLEIAAIFIIVILLTLIGLIGKTVLGKTIGKLVSEILHRLPGLGFLFKSFTKLSDTFYSFSDNKYSRTVLIEYPRRGVWVIAFMTGVASKAMSPNPNKDYRIVFMPTTPNPTTGFLMIIPKEQIIILDIPIEDAIKVLMSGGLIQDENIKAPQWLSKVEQKNARMED